MIDYNSHIDGDLPDDNDEQTCPKCGGQMEEQSDYGYGIVFFACNDCDYFEGI